MRRETEYFKKKVNFKNYKAVKPCTDFEKQYKLSTKLGEGAFGTVFKAVHRPSKVPVAVKIITKAKVAEQDCYLDLLKQELDCLE